MKRSVYPGKLGVTTSNSLIWIYVDNADWSNIMDSTSGIVSQK